MKDKSGYTPKQNKEIEDYLTRPSKSADIKQVEMALNLRKSTIDALNKYEDGPNLVEEAIRMSSTPVPGYVGGATPDPTVPTRAERIAGQKQLEKLAVQPDSRGVFQKAVAADEAAYKKSQQYPNEATPEQVAMLAYNMEKSRQMTGGDGRYDKPKAIIKKKKIIPYVPTKIKFNTYQPYIPEPPSPELIRQTENFKKLLQDTKDKKIRDANAGLLGLIPGGFKR